jgi:hypothetical protein
LRTGEFGEVVVVALVVIAAVMHLFRLQLVHIGGP